VRQINFTTTTGHTLGVVVLGISAWRAAIQVAEVPPPGGSTFLTAISSNKLGVKAFVIAEWRAEIITTSPSCVRGQQSP